MYKQDPTYYFALRDDLKEEKRFLPTRATNFSSGWDVRCAQEDRQDIIVHPGEYIKVPLGFRAICPPGWWFELKPRSSTFAKKHLNCLYGTIDCDYRGWVTMVGQYLPDTNAKLDSKTLRLEFGEAIGQIIPVKLQEMNIEEISNKDFDYYCNQEINERGIGGFGSTGK